MSPQQEQTPPIPPHRPEGYVEPNGCHNCKHVRDHGDGYEGPYLKCHLIAEPPYPVPEDSDEEYEIKHALWAEWARTADVMGYGLCPSWAAGGAKG